MTLLDRSAAPSSSWVEPPISVNWLAFLLIATSMIELTILRVGTRTAIHIPDIEEVAGVYSVAATMGRLAFFSALVLLSLLLVKVVVERYEAGDFHAAAAVTVFLVTAAGVGSGVVGSDWASPVVAVVVAVIGTMVAVRTRRRVVALATGAFVIGYLLSALQSLAQPGLTGDLIDELGAAHSIRLAEMLAVGAALSSWPLWRRLTNQPWWIGGRLAPVSLIAGVVATVLLIGSASTTTVLMMWNFGLTGTLPAVLYGLATTSVLLTIGSLVHRSSTRPASAMVLIMLGGVGLTSTYQSGLTIVGLSLLLPPPRSAP